MEPTRAQLFDILTEVKDPEVPVLDVVEMGIVRDAVVEGGTVRVDITPTYSGCPAMKAIENEIVRVLTARGFADVRVRTIFKEPWTSDWMTDEARRKLKEYGIAPPERGAMIGLPILFDEQPKTTPCPFCESEETTRTSEFGATACKALYYCNACEQPFEHFKCI